MKSILFLLSMAMCIDGFAQGRQEEAPQAPNCECFTGNPSGIRLDELQTKMVVDSQYCDGQGILINLENHSVYLDSAQFSGCYSQFVLDSTLIAEHKIFLSTPFISNKLLVSYFNQSPPPVLDFFQLLQADTFLLNL